MLTRARNIYFVLMLATGCGATVTTPNLPWQEKLWRATDFVLAEPGYTQASDLVAAWQKYMTQTLSSEKLAQELEVLANDPAIVGFLQDPKGRLAPLFENETRRILANYGNKTFQAWRLRHLSGKIILAESVKKLADIDTSVTRREVGLKFVTIPISGTGFNYSLDAEWDVSRLPQFPLSQINSEFFFVQTDATGQILSLSGENFLPEKAYRLMSGGKFRARLWGLSEGYRIITSEVNGFRLILCYPFAGYLFYLIRVAIALLCIFAGIFAVLRIASIRSATKRVIENRTGAWLGDHYQQSLNINKDALGISDRTLGIVSEIKERDQEVFRRLGEHIRELNTNFTAQARHVMEAAEANTGSPANLRPVQKNVAPTRAIHRRPGLKPAKLIASDAAGEIKVDIELDLPLKDERPLGPVAKATYLATLRNKARAASGVVAKDFIHDEKIDNYNYTPEEPLPIPEKKIAAAPVAVSPDNTPADLEYLQKYRYAPKSAALPMETPQKDATVLTLHEDLHGEALLISKDE